MESTYKPVPSTGSKVPRLSPSIARILVARSPLHAYDAHRLGGNRHREPTESQTRGTILDRLFFRKAEDLVVVEAPDWRTTGARKAKTDIEATGKLPVLAPKLQDYLDAVKTWRARIEELGIIVEGDTHRRFEWLSEGDQVAGVPCSGEVDVVSVEVEKCRATIFDLKTCTDASADTCARAINMHGYDIQHAAYLEAVETEYPNLAGRVSFAFLFAEVDPPFAVNVVELAGSYQDLGRLKWKHAVDVWGHCLLSSSFPGFSTVSRIEARPWQFDALPDDLVDVEESSV